MGPAELIPSSRDCTKHSTVIRSIQLPIDADGAVDDNKNGILSPGHNRGLPLEAVRTCFPETVSIDTQRRYVRVSVLREVRPSQQTPFEIFIREPYKNSFGRHRKVT